MLSERVNPERSNIFLPLEKESKSNISSFISSSADEIRLDADQIAILSVIANGPAATYPKIAQKTGFSESKVYRISNALQKKGIVERVGSRKTGIWKVLANSSMPGESREAAFSQHEGESFQTFPQLNHDIDLLP